MTWSAGAVLTAAQLNEYVPQSYSTWSPTITATSGTFTTVSGSGRYIKMGKVVHFTLTVIITTAGTAAGAVVFPLPVAAQSAGNTYIGSGRESASTGAALQMYLASATEANVFRYDNTTAIATGRTFILAGTYEVS